MQTQETQVGEVFIMKAIGYTRVSTEEQAKEGISLFAQRTKIMAYCDLNGLDLVGIKEDAGKSGKDLKREGVQELIDMVEKKKIDAVVVYKLDRLSRRVKDTVEVMELVEKRGVAFHSITEKIDTTTAMGKFFLNILASMNQWERDTISERTKDALGVKKRNGQRTGGIPYGYSLGEDGSTLVEIPSEQKTILKIMSLVRRHNSYMAICKVLTKEGMPCPSGSKKWHPQTVLNIWNRNKTREVA
jgi:site-specific DNA recombinase